MGWPKKHDGLVLYFEVKDKSYLLVDKSQESSRGYDYVGEISLDKDPERPILSHGTCSRLYLAQWEVKRASWDDMPEEWQKALGSQLEGDPEDHRGLWRMPGPPEKMHVRIHAYNSKVGRKIEPVNLRISNFPEASKICLEFVESNDLGCSDCTDGKIYSDGVEIARVSYNGKVWKDEGLGGLLYDPYDKGEK